MTNDQIKLNNLRFYGYHGLFAEENKLGQIFKINATLYTSLQKAGNSDRMEDSVHYGEVFQTIQEIVEGQPKNLIEAVGEEIANSIFRKFSTVNACTIEVEKPAPPIPGHYDSVAIQIYRERTE